VHQRGCRERTRLCSFRTVVAPSAARYSCDVIWFFDKDGEKLRYEISRQRPAGRYRVVITHPDGSESVEEVERPTELIERSVEAMESLREEGWHSVNREGLKAQG
jgi:5'-3' exonuclease